MRYGQVLKSLVVLALAAPACARFDRGAESYRVYDAVLTAMARDAVQLHAGINGRRVAIVDHTEGDDSGDRETLRERLRKAVDGISVDAIENYTRVRDERRALAPLFRADVPYELVPGDESWLRSNFESIERQGGLIRFSPVGFSRSEREALVYVSHFCGVLCGTGHFVWLRLRPEGWQIELAVLTVIS